jgi:dihydrofolate reductase
MSEADAPASATPPRVGLIWAEARGGVIGAGGVMPWHLPEDLAHFKQTTGAAPVIMGRKTWDSLPERFRPLPGRMNVVVTRQADWSAAGAIRAASLPEAIAACAGNPQAWIIGGAEIYALAVTLAHVAEVTEIDADFEGDAFAPPFGPQWRELTRRRQRSANGLEFDFVTYRKSQAGA